MRKVKFTYWKDGDWWLGYLEEYPEYQTQGETMEELKENLRDIYKDVTGGEVPGVKKVDELEVT